MRLSLVLASLFLVGACNDPDGPTYPYPPGGGGDDGSGGGGGSGSGSGGSTSPASPKILSIATNVMTLHEGEQLVVTAVVTDPNGIDDVIGGQLATSGGAVYGSFATDASEGAYSLSLSWSAIDVTQSIDTDAGTSTSRPFRATFFDAEGNSTYRDVTVAMQCQNATDAACSGTCTDMSMPSTDHCGSCDHKCPAANFASHCYLDSMGGVCWVEAHISIAKACSAVCAGPYPVCYEAYAHYGSNPEVPIDCATVPAAMQDTTSFSSIDCICGDI
ncbi:MAG TPA: hypothetical protein VL326_33440 [Kofleriaceae bacterium]|nr:hypothetical protein [Kofleriaceae bacterium]